MHEKRSWWCRLGIHRFVETERGLSYRKLKCTLCPQEEIDLPL